MEWIRDDDNHDSSLSVEEPNSDETLVESGALKKGPWTPAEDVILMDYVKKHGEGNWNAVQKFSGLSRCGKSCRLRWANHLRPDLKKGAITSEEEDTIIRLHSKLGNKWARMAAELPGRTDNEIKNFWNTRIKRLHRAGLQIYPEDVVSQKKSIEPQQSQISSTVFNELHGSQMEAGILGVPVFKIEHHVSSELYSSKSLGLPSNNMLPQDLIPSHVIHYPAPTMRTRKRLRESDFHGLNDTATSSPFSRSNSNALCQHHQPYDLPPLPGSYSSDDRSLCVIPGSHALINGTHSTSNPNFGSAKLELPSFQSSDSDNSFWDSPPFHLPPLKCTDTIVQPPQARPSQLQGTPDTDGLLESLVWPPNPVKTTKIETDPKEKAAIGDWDDILVDISEPEWETFADPLPPMGPFTAANLDDFKLTGFSTGELQPTDAMLAPQAKTSYDDPKTLPTDIRSSNSNHNGNSYQLNSLRPDAWLNANLLSADTELGKDFLALQEVLSSLEDNTNHLAERSSCGSSKTFLWTT